MKSKATIYDIAKTAGVSPATVSRMIHQPDIVTEKTRNKILAAFSSFNMSPEDLATKKRAFAPAKKSMHANNTILVCIPTWGNPFYDDIVEGIHSYLDNTSYNMIITVDIPKRSNMAFFLNYCSELHVAGIITMYPLSEDILRQLSANYPLVQCSEYNPFYQKVPYVSIDDYSISKVAIAHLINKGCKKIAFFSASYDYRYVQSRFRAYKNMLNGNGMEVLPEYVIQISDFSYGSILNAACGFFQQDNPPDAIFATSDKHAHAAVKAALSMGYKVPEDVKVFGFDDTMYATLSTPTISTISQPRKELGTDSAAMLIDIIKNPYAQAKSIMLPTKLLLRESC